MAWTGKYQNRKKLLASYILFSYGLFGPVLPFCHTFGLESGAALIEEYVPFTGSVFQNPKTQYFNVDTTAELAFPCENMGIPSRDIQKRVRECAEEFGLGKLLNLLNNQGKAILVITHDEELVADCCDRVVFLHEKEEDSGRIS